MPDADGLGVLGRSEALAKTGFFVGNPQETTWVGSKIEWGRVSGNHQCKANREQARVIEA